MTLLAALVLALPVQESESERRPARPVRVRSEVHVRIKEFVPDERDHDAYHQLFPVDQSTYLLGPRGPLTGRVTYFTECESDWRRAIPAAFPRMGLDAPVLPALMPAPSPMPLLPAMPAELPALTGQEVPVTPFDPFQPTVGNTARIPVVTLSARVSPLMLRASASSSIVGSLRSDPPATGIPPTPPPPAIPPGPPPPAPPPPPPPSTKPSAYAGLGGVAVGDDSDMPLLSGPELDLVLLHDVTGWRPAAWLPESTSLHLVGRALFGTMDLFDVTADVQLYSISAALGIPVVHGGDFRLDASLSAGPAFLKTDLGDAVGASVAAGLRAQQALTRNLSLFGVLEAELFHAKSTSAYGPAFNLGLNLTW